MLFINKALEIKASITWITDSFKIVREQLLTLILLTIMSTICGTLPFIGAFLAPLFIARFAQITQQIENHEQVLFSSILNDFFSNVNVIKLGFINVIFNLVIISIEYLITNRGLSLSDLLVNHFILLILLLVIGLLFGIAMWLAPIICIQNPHISPYAAMWLGLKSLCFYNTATFIIFGVLCILCTILAIIPVLLGLFFWLPMLNVMPYFIYKSLFIQKNII